MTNRTALGKIVDILRMELAPSLSYEERIQIYEIADTLEAIIMEETLQGEDFRKHEALYKTKQMIDPQTIYDVLGSC